MDYEKSIKKAKNISDIFEIVKEMVRESLGLEQAGLMVGMSDLGMHPKGFVGAFYSLDANTIIINKRPLARILEKSPHWYRHYIFYIMLHEYIHSIGSYDEMQTKQLVSELTNRYFGQNNIITQFASHMEKFIPQISDLSDSGKGFQHPKDISIDFVQGIDRKNTNYIN